MQVTQLPQVLFQLILAFVDEYIVGTPTTSVDMHTLITLFLDENTGTFRLSIYAPVCKEWNVFIKEYLCQHVMSILTIPIFDGSRQELVNHRRTLSIRRDFLRHIELHVPTTAHISSYPWCALFIHLPHLYELNLMEFSPTNTGLVEILKAASHHCRQLRSLQLPAIVSSMPYYTVKWKNVTFAVLDAIKEWHNKGQYGGLRRLVLPTRDLSTLKPNLAQSTHFIEQICEYCPLIEELVVGIGGLVNEIVDHYRPEPWMITPETFERFCRSCNHLTWFHWIVVPFATVYFEVFGRYSKPKLTKLKLTTANIWGTPHERGQCMTSTQYERGVGKTAINVDAVLHACPALQELEVVFNDSYLLFNGYEMNMELYGDRFFTTLIRSCPMISSIRIDSISSVPLIMSFTDKSLAALATIPTLTILQLPCVNVSENGLFMLLKNVPNEYRAPRVYEITIGDNSNPIKMAFYQTIESLLKKLIKHQGPLGCFHRHVTLEIRNGNQSIVPYEYSMWYTKRLMVLLKQFRTKYGYFLNLDMATQGLTTRNESFENIVVMKISSPLKKWEKHEKNSCVNHKNGGDVYVAKGKDGYGGFEDLLSFLLNDTPIGYKRQTLCYQHMFVSMPHPHLPQALIHLILTFVEPEYDASSPFPIALRKRVESRLKEYSLVSKEWNRFINDFLSHYTLSNFTITIAHQTRYELVNYRRRISLMRHSLRHVKIVAHMTPSSYPWCTLLMHMPHLHSLNLMDLSPLNANLVDIVKSASLHCRQLRSLELPTEFPLIPDPTLDWTTLTSAVLAGIKVWHNKGQCGGLRRLVHPSRDRLKLNLAQSTHFIEQICEHCPLIEEVAVGTAPDILASITRYDSGEPWIITPKTFELFCRSCTDLTVFNWRVIPFATVFFEVFGRYPKPKLTKLILRTADIWDSAEERRQCMTREEYERGEGKKAKNVEALLHACPTLRELEIVHDYRGDSYEMNKELYGDEFFTTLVRSCPMISSIVLYDDWYVPPIMSFTDKSLVALGTLPALRSLELPSCNISAKGLFMLLKNVPNTYLASRKYHLMIGTDEHVENCSDLGFYEIFEELLKKLNKCKVPLDCFDRKLILEVTNGYTSNVYNYSEDYMKRIIPLIRVFQIKFVNLLLLEVETVRRMDTLDSFIRIQSFKITPCSDTKEKRIEDVFITVEDELDDEDGNEDFDIDEDQDFDMDEDEDFDMDDEVFSDDSDDLFFIDHLARNL